MNPAASHRVAFIAGLLLGIGIGLFYTWVIDPVELAHTSPPYMRRDYRQDWERMAILAYVADGDFERARRRLEGLDQQEIAAVLRDVIEEYIAAGQPASVLRQLAALAQALDVYTPAMAIYMYTVSPPETTPPGPSLSPLPASAVATPTPFPTFTPTPTPKPTVIWMPTFTPAPTVPLPSLTYTPTGAPVLPAPPKFQLTAQELICAEGRAPRIEVIVEDASGNGVPGVELWLLWADGADRAVTGLKPDYGSGYADFDLITGFDYQLSVEATGVPLVRGLRATACPNSTLVGSWRVVLTRSEAGS